jgi:hypothetical protein
MSVTLTETTALGGLPTADPAWTEACIEAFDLEPRLISVDGGHAPLARVRGRLELAGATTLFEPGDFAARDGMVLERLVEIAVDDRLPLLLFRLPSTSPTIAAIRERVPLLLQRDAGSCPVIEIDDDPEAALSKRHRQDLRRAGRRAAAFGDLTVEVHEPTPGDVDELLDVALQIEARSWKGRAGTALAVDQRRERFYRAYCAHAAESATLRVAFLRLGDEPAAMQIAVERAGALWLLKIGYDERFSTASPGQLLMLETLRWAADRGLERYEFLGAARDWTRAWTRTEWSCTTVMAYPANPRGAAALAVDGARWARARIRS